MKQTVSCQHGTPDPIPQRAILSACRVLTTSDSKSIQLNCAAAPHLSGAYWSMALEPGYHRHHCAQGLDHEDLHPEAVHPGCGVHTAV